MRLAGHAWMVQKEGKAAEGHKKVKNSMCHAVHV